MAAFRNISNVLITLGRFSPAVALFATLAMAPCRAQTPVPDTALTVEEVVKLNRAGFSEELIVTKIKKYAKAFDLSTEELVELKKQGLSDNIIRFLLDPTQPYTPSPPPVAATAQPAKKYPEDSLATLTPSEPGLYLFNAKTPSKVDLKVMLGIHKGKLLKGKSIAYLAGPSAKLRVRTTKPIFYLRLPEGKEISDVVLISLLQKGDRRELDGIPGLKTGLNPDDVWPFDQVEAGPKLFKLTPPALTGGEYLFFLVGAAEPDKGTFGKGFDFGVDAELPAKKK
jgi:hypothetical protein